MVVMKRATITFPDDLADAVDQFRDAQETPPTLTTLMQTALREFLQDRGFLRSQRRLRLGPVGRSGRSDVSRNHDDYFAGIKK
jgi:metal-responsive CopG/Arc/MetJ family transcriptional regulator